VPFPAGGSTDIIARLVSPHLTEEFGQQFIVDNRSGAGGTIGAEIAARAAPDGYTMCATASKDIIWNPILRLKLPYDVMKDFTPVLHSTMRKPIPARSILALARAPCPTSSAHR